MPRKAAVGGGCRALPCGIIPFIEVAGIQKKQVIDALVNEDFDDLEDRLQVECARMINARFIVTRDITDFSASSIPAILPEDLLQTMAEEGKAYE
ncbi:MAG: hypothetical protein LBB89_12630 [Treponema sp.]|nr:hypothetical protein [Treponema sp.]